MANARTATIATLEHARLKLQAALDATKSQAERNRLGQFSTPPRLADDILSVARSILPSRRKVRFLDPAFGTGAFYSALLRLFPPSRVGTASGFEVDPHYAEEAQRLWKDTPLQLELGDFTKAQFPKAERDKANLIVCNPPYVRHHHLDRSEKPRLCRVGASASGVRLNGLAGLYCHFICISHAWLSDDALAVWLVPSEFMDVNYGRQVKDYLLSEVTLLRIHRFDPAEVQFDDALVSSAVVCFKNGPPSENHEGEFTYGGSLTEPRVVRSVRLRSLSPSDKWTGIPSRSRQRCPRRAEPKLSDFFIIKRGIATGANSFFVLTEKAAKARGIDPAFLKPILPSPRHLQGDEVTADAKGLPLTEPRLFVLSCSLPQSEVEQQCPELWRYLQTGVAARVHERYLCTHRSPWYAQEDRPPAPFLCTYMGRRKPTKGLFRFILNHSKAIAANVYLMLYPKPELARAISNDPRVPRAVWAALGKITSDTLVSVGRVYGGGLHKVEPKELGETPASVVVKALDGAAVLRERQGTFFAT